AEREGLLALRARPSGRCRKTATFFVAATLLLVEPEGFSSNRPAPDKAKSPARGLFALLAEREGFEPSIGY
ncbi:MAG: hypothetical protein WBN02_09550, partial [Sedimenticolaceae bacterium]